MNYCKIIYEKYCNIYFETPLSLSSPLDVWKYLPSFGYLFKDRFRVNYSGVSVLYELSKLVNICCIYNCHPYHKVLRQESWTRTVVSFLTFKSMCKNLLLPEPSSTTKSDIVLSTAYHQLELELLHHKEVSSPFLPLLPCPLMMVWVMRPTETLSQKNTIHFLISINNPCGIMRKKNRISWLKKVNFIDTVWPEFQRKCITKSGKQK